MNSLKKTASETAAKTRGSKTDPLIISWSIMALGLLLSLSGCSTSMSYSPGMVLAQVNGEAVTAQALDEAFTAKHQGHQPFLAGVRAVTQFLEKVIDKRLLLQEAQRIGLDQDADIDQAAKTLRTRRAVDLFYRDATRSKVAISEEAVVAAHKQMSYRFQARHFLANSRTTTEKALEQIHAGKEFAEVALQLSQSQTASKGGYLGFVQWGQLEPELEEKLWSLEAGQISEPFETQEGWNIIYAVERITVEPLPLDKAGPKIRAVLAKRESKRLADALRRDLMERWKPQLNAPTLRALLNAGDAQELSPDLTLAEVAGEKITLAQVTARVHMDKVRKLEEAMAMRALHHFVEQEIFKILIRKEALAQGYGEKSEVLKEIESFRDELAVERLLNKVVYAEIEASNEEAEMYWQSHPEKFTEPSAAKLSIILTESEKEATEALASIRSGEDFARLARALSKHSASAQLGGEIGWIIKGRSAPEIEQVAFSLADGELGIAQTRAGYVVIQVQETKAERLKPLVEVVEQARMLAFKNKLQQTLNVWLQKLREASVIDIDEEAIRRAVAFYEEKSRKQGAAGDG